MPSLLRDLENESGVCLDFISEAVSRFEEDETVPPLFTKAMIDISSKLSTMSMNDNYKPYVNVSHLAFCSTCPPYK
jgi:ubiquitin conjugation factor E4 B